MAYQSPSPQPQPQPDPETVAILGSMGLASDDLREAVLNANDEALECTGNDVVSRAGYTRWASPLRQLGDIYAPKGFTRERPNKFELLVSPDRTFALTPAPGDSNTGTDKMPSTRIERGPLTGQAVVGNRHQLRLDILSPEIAKTAMKIWLLLAYYDEQQEEVRVELSLPIEFERKLSNGRGFVTAFEEPRLILPPISLAPGADIGRDEEDGGDQIVVPVSRR
ncbi:MAG: hypothetical protein ACTHM1_13160 [Solirubrobacteraceae bacterium]